jgi:hypothetical protein
MKTIFKILNGGLPNSEENNDNSFVIIDMINVIYVTVDTCIL